MVNCTTGECWCHVTEGWIAWQWVVFALSFIIRVWARGGSWLWLGTNSKAFVQHKPRERIRQNWEIWVPTKHSNPSLMVLKLGQTVWSTPSSIPPPNQNKAHPGSLLCLLCQWMFQTLMSLVYPIEVQAQATVMVEATVMVAGAWVIAQCVM